MVFLRLSGFWDGVLYSSLVMAEMICWPFDIWNWNFYFLFSLGKGLHELWIAIWNLWRAQVRCAVLPLVLSGLVCCSMSLRLASLAKLSLLGCPHRCYPFFWSSRFIVDRSAVDLSSYRHIVTSCMSVVCAGSQHGSASLHMLATRDVTEWGYLWRELKRAIERCSISKGPAGASWRGGPSAIPDVDS